MLQQFLPRIVDTYPRVCQGKSWTKVSWKNLTTKLLVNAKVRSGSCNNPPNVQIVTELMHKLNTQVFHCFEVKK